MSIIDVTLIETKMTRRLSAKRNCPEVAGWNSLKVSMARDKPLIRAEIKLNVL